MESSSSGLPKNPREADCSCRLQRSEMEFSSSGLLKNRRAADCCCRLQRSEMESSSLRIAEESSSSRLLLPSATSWNGILLFPDCLRILERRLLLPSAMFCHGILLFWIGEESWSSNKKKSLMISCKAFACSCSCWNWEDDKTPESFAVQGEGNSKRKGVGRVLARESIGVVKQKKHA